MRQFPQFVGNCSECQHKYYSVGIDGYVCSKNDLSTNYSLKEGRYLYKKNIHKITPSCPMYPQAVEVSE